MDRMILAVTDLHENWKPKQINVKMPDGTNFQMAAFGYGTSSPSCASLSKKGWNKTSGL
jgi:hypothetical protein